MSLTLNEEHDAQAKAKLLEQFKTAINFLNWLEANVESIQEIEGVLLDLFQMRQLDYAEGTNLDNLGKIVGAERLEGMDDETFRIRIRARVLLNLSSGTPDEILNIVTLVLNNDALTMTYGEYYPASYLLNLSGAITDEAASEIGEILSAASPAAVAWGFVYSIVADANTFTFSDTSAVQSDTARGFADYTPVGQTWTDRTLTGFGASDLVRDVAWDGESTLVAVGDNGSVSVSTDLGQTWSAATNFTSDDVMAVIHDGTQFVCVLWLNCDVYSSVDGVTWTLRANNSSGMGGNPVVFATKLAYGGGVYNIKCGYFDSSTQVIMHSTNLTSWTVPLSPSTGGAGTSAQPELGFLEYITGSLGPMWLAGDGDSGNNMWHSADGQTYTLYAHNLSGMSPLAVAYSTAGVGGQFRMTSINGEMSKNPFSSGTVWNVQDPGTWDDLSANIYDVVGNGDLLVFVGEGGLVSYDDNGTVGGPSVVSGISASDLRRVVYTGENYIAVGKNGTIISSTDGKTGWTVRNTGGADFGSPNYARRGLLVAGRTVVAYGSSRRLMTSEGVAGSTGGQLAGLVSNM
jgi:hypothetical protein